MVNRLHLINIKPLAAVIGIEKENTNEPKQTNPYITECCRPNGIHRLSAFNLTGKCGAANRRIQ